MTMDEIVDQVSFSLGLPAVDNTEGLDIKKAVLIAFRELKRYMRKPTDKTVPYSRRIKLSDVGIVTKKVLGVQASRPRIGLTMSSIDSGNVFQVAAAANVGSSIGNTTSLNIQPIVTEMAMAQVRNSLSTDLQWSYDQHNDVIYCAHRDPLPVSVTIRYVPDYQDVSEVEELRYQDYLIRMSEANMKKALGRARSKYTVEGSNVNLDGDTLLTEAREELQAIREELEAGRNKFVVLN